MNKGTTYENGVPLPTYYNITFPNRVLAIFITDVANGTDITNISCFAIRSISITNTSFAVNDGNLKDGVYTGKESFGDKAYEFAIGF